MYSRKQSKTVVAIISIINGRRLLRSASKGYNWPCSLIFAALVLFTCTQSFSQAKPPAPIKGLDINLEQLEKNQCNFDESMGGTGDKKCEPLVNEDKNHRSYSYGDWVDAFDFALGGGIGKTVRYASYLYGELPDFPYERVFSSYEKVRFYSEGFYQSLPELNYDDFNNGMQQAGTAFQHFYDSLPEFPYESLSRFTQSAYEQGSIFGQFFSEGLKNGYSYTLEQMSQGYSAARPSLPGFPQFNNVGGFMTFAGDTTYRRYFAPTQLLSPQSLLGSLAIMLTTGYSNVAIASEVASFVTNPALHMVLFTLTTAVTPTAVSSAASYAAGQRLGSEQILVNEPTVRKHFILEFSYAFDGKSRDLNLYPVAALPEDTAELPEPWNKLYNALMSNDITAVQLSWDTSINGITSGLLAQYTRSNGQQWVRRVSIKHAERMDENIESLLHHEMADVISEKRELFLTSSLLQEDILFDTVIAFASPDNKKHHLQADDLMLEMVSHDDRSIYVAGLCSMAARTHCMHYLQLAWSYFPYPHYTPFIDVDPLPSNPETGLRGIMRSLENKNKAELLLSTGEKMVLVSLMYLASHIRDFSGGNTKPTVESAIIQAIRDNDLDVITETSFQPSQEVWLSVFKEIAYRGSLQKIDTLNRVFVTKRTDVFLLINEILADPELDSYQETALVHLLQISDGPRQQEIFEQFMRRAPEDGYLTLATLLINNQAIPQLLGAQLKQADSAKLHTILQVAFIKDCSVAYTLWELLGDDSQESLAMYMLDTAKIDMLVRYFVPWKGKTSLKELLWKSLYKQGSKVFNVIYQLPEDTVIGVIERLRQQIDPDPYNYSLNLLMNMAKMNAAKQAVNADLR